MRSACGMTSVAWGVCGNTAEAETRRQAPPRLVVREVLRGPTYCSHILIVEEAGGRWGKFSRQSLCSSLDCSSEIRSQGKSRVSQKQVGAFLGTLERRKSSRIDLAMLEAPLPPLDSIPIQEVATGTVAPAPRATGHISLADRGLHPDGSHNSPNDRHLRHIVDSTLHNCNPQSSPRRPDVYKCAFVLLYIVGQCGRCHQPGTYIHTGRTHNSPPACNVLAHIRRITDVPAGIHG